MKKQFLVINTKSGEQTIYTEAGLKIVMADKELKKMIEVIDECDEEGRTLESYRVGNFLSDGKKNQNQET